MGGRGPKAPNLLLRIHALHACETRVRRLSCIRQEDRSMQQLLRRFSRAAVGLSIALCFVNCVGRQNYYGNWESPENRIAGLDIRIDIHAFEFGRPTDSNFTNWSINVWLSPPVDQVKDTTSLKNWLEASKRGRVDSIEIYTADSSGLRRERLVLIGFHEDGGRFYLARPWPPALVVKAYMALWHEGGKWTTQTEEFLLPYRKRLEAYSGV